MMMDGLVAWALANGYTDEIGSGITAINGTATGFDLVTNSGQTLSFTIPNMHTHSNLNTILEKLTLDGSNNLLFDGQPIKSNVDLTPYLKTVDADTKYEPKDSSIVKDSSYVHTDNNYTNADKLKVSNVISGHSIEDNTQTFTQRKNLKFTGVSITDDSLNDATVINFGTPVSNPQEPKESLATTNGQSTFEVINHTVGSKYLMVLVDGIRISYSDYTDIDTTHIQLNSDIASTVKQNTVITSFSTVIETMIVNSSVLNGGTF